MRNQLKSKITLTKKVVRIACPDCGFDLGSDKDEKLLKQIEIEKNTKMIRDSVPAETDIEKPLTVTIGDSMEPTAIETDTPALTTQMPSIINCNQESTEKETALPLKPKENEKTREKKENTKQDKSEGCNEYFGYLASLPKGTATPDECFSCNRLLDCRKQTKNSLCPNKAELACLFSY